VSWLADFQTACEKQRGHLPARQVELTLYKLFRSDSQSRDAILAPYAATSWAADRVAVEPNRPNGWRLPEARDLLMRLARREEPAYSAATDDEVWSAAREVTRHFSEVRDAQRVVEGVCVIVAARHGVRFDPLRPPAVDPEWLRNREAELDAEEATRRARVLREAEQRQERLSASEYRETREEREAELERIRNKQADALARKRPGRRKTN
jgi:hypothetical protein